MSFIQELEHFPDFSSPFKNKAAWLDLFRAWYTKPTVACSSRTGVDFESPSTRSSCSGDFGCSWPLPLGVLADGFSEREVSDSLIYSFCVVSFFSQTFPFSLPQAKRQCAENTKNNTRQRKLKFPASLASCFIKNILESTFLSNHKVSVFHFQYQLHIFIKVWKCFRMYLDCKERHWATWL